MHCLGCGYNLNQLTEPRCPECGRGFVARDQRTWGSAKAFRYRKAATVFGRLLACALLVVTTVVFYLVGSGEDVVMSILMAWFVAFVPVVLLAGIWHGCTLMGRRMPSKRLLATLITCVLLNISYLTGWPLRLGFWLSRTELHTLAQQIEAGHPPAVPVRAGVYVVVKHELRDGHATLWISGGGNPDGFVLGMTNNDIRNNFNLWSYDRLDKDWHIVHED